MRSLVLLAALSVAPRLAAAQSVEAETLFSEGERLFAAGKYSEACEAFAASNRIEPRAGTLINLGACREQTKQYATAWVSYKEALGRVKDPKKKQLAEARVKALEAKMSYLTIAVADAAKLPGLTVARDGKPLDPALWNRAVPVDGGSYTITAKAPGKPDWSSTVEVKPEKDKITVDVPKLDLPPPKPAPKPDPVVVTPTPEPTPPSTPAEPHHPMTGKRKAAIAFAVIGVGAAAGGVVFGRAASKSEDDAFALCPDPAVACTDAARANDLLDKGKSKALLANVSFGVAGVAVVGAVVLWVTGKPKAGGVAIVPTATRDSAVVDVGWRF